MKFHIRCIDGNAIQVYIMQITRKNIYGCSTPESAVRIFKVTVKMEENLSVAAQISVLAIQFGVILFAARLCGIAATKLRIPSVLGELIAGIIIGPYVLGSLPIPLHGFHNGLFPLVEGSSIPVSMPLYGIATLGSIILLFISGLETDLRMFFRYSLVGTIVGLGGVIFSFVFGAGLGVITLKASL